MEILLYAVGIILMAIAIAVSIALHEVGHLVPAKLFNVRVPQYMMASVRPCSLSAAARLSTVSKRFRWAVTFR